MKSILMSNDTYVVQPCWNLTYVYAENQQGVKKERREEKGLDWQTDRERMTENSGG